MRGSALAPSSQSFNSLLNFLCFTREIQTSWMVCSAALRLGTEMNDGSWVLLVRLLLHEGKLQRAEMLLSSGFGQQTSNYDLVVDSFSSRREFTAAMHSLNTMKEMGFNPTLRTLSSILEESCKFGDSKMAGFIMKRMVVMDLLPLSPSFDFDWTIIRFCELGKTFAAKMIFEKACRRNFHLESATYASILQELAQKGLTNEALKVFDIMLQRGVSLEPGSLDVFVCGICSGEPSEKVDVVIMNTLRDGFLPKALDLSKYIVESCSKGRWKEATELLNLALDKGILLDASCICSLMKHFLNNGFLEMAISLHERVKGLAVCLNLDSYHALLESLFMKGRAMEAIGVFDCMREKNVLTSFSFVIMIRALCHKKELRKAMNLHDEMMRLGFKPDTATYKHLISSFQ